MLSQVTYSEALWHPSHVHENDRSVPSQQDLDQVIVFSNVDGTLLDAQHQLGVPKSTLERVYDSDTCNLVLVSSRTLAELFAFQESVGLYGECIAESGGVVASYTPLSPESEGQWSWEVGGPGLLAVQRLAAPIAETLDLVRQTADTLGISLTVLTDLSTSDLAQRHGYTMADAERARHREVSVLIDPSVHSHPRAATFFRGLRRSGCSILFGEQWISIVWGSDKGRAAQAYLSALRARGDAAPLTIGIGNDENDVAFLRVVDRPFVVRNPTIGHARTLMTIPGATLLTQVGCAGWTEMVGTIFPQQNQRGAKR